MDFIYGSTRMLPTTASVRWSAGLLAQRSELLPRKRSAKIGYEIKSKYNRKYDYQRAKYEDPLIIQKLNIFIVG
jgi:hypothetical protein